MIQKINEGKSRNTDKRPKAVVLFSGGIDSTFLVAKEIGKYEKMILITYKVPGMINLENSAKSAEKLRKIFGDKIEHKIIDISQRIKKTRGGAAKCIKDNIKYRMGYAWCLGCKINMHLQTIEYCRENGIGFVLDGSNKFDLHALEQYRDFKEYIKEKYRQNKIEFLSPHYEYGGEGKGSSRNKIIDHIGLTKSPTQSKIKYLEGIGFSTGTHIGDQYRSVQPSCLGSLPFNGLRLFIKIFSQERNYIKYTKEKTKKWENDHR